MKIVSVDPFYLKMPEINDAADGTQDTFLVRIRTDDGVEGWGESDASPLVSMAAFTFLDSNSDPMSAVPWLVVFGFSMGIAFPTMTTATQNSLDLPDLGAGTAAINFFRTLGQTIGVGAFGALLTGSIRRELGKLDSSIDTAELLSTPEDIKELEPALRSLIEGAVAVGTNMVFVASVPVLALMVVASLFLPELELRTTTALEGAPGGESDG